jgi:Icc-related predicted phosphoesterase
MHRDAGHSFVTSLDPDGVDVLVIAGDLACADAVPDALELLCAHFDRSVVVYVHGNHEVYGTTLASLRADLRRAARHLPRLRWLDCDAVTIAGVRFLGAPLWFARAQDADAAKARMHDFSAIPDLEAWVYRENERARAFLEAELRASDVVVTHHLPCNASVAPRWRDSPLNAFFVCDLEPLLRSRRPSLWIHGHTHESVDVLVGETRVVCNPFGYARLEENPRFDPAKEIAVP